MSIICYPNIYLFDFNMFTSSPTSQKSIQNVTEKRNQDPFPTLEIQKQKYNSTDDRMFSVRKHDFLRLNKLEACQGVAFREG